MKRALSIQQDMVQVHTIEDLTEVFEGIASIRIAKLRNRVVSSKEFFAELWQTYQGLRINAKDRLARPDEAIRAGDVFVIITGDGKLTGTLDERIVKGMLGSYLSAQNTDIVTVGTHGATLLGQQGIKPSQTFHMPESDANLNVGEMIEALNRYNRITVFYQTYESLRLQKVARIELTAAVRSLGETITSTDEEVISSRDYIFEPSLGQIIEYMESVMLEVALIQIIMETKLAQYAARFNAMSTAKRRARDLTADYSRSYYRAKRGESDERLKEIMKVVTHYGHYRTN